MFDPEVPGDPFPEINSGHVRLALSGGPLNRHCQTLPHDE
jgi:hypothetical protein